MKTKIWSLTTRISHWLLAVGFTIAFITGENEWNMNYHFAFGALVGGILLFRIIYGLIGPKYSNFRDFPMEISKQIDFIKNYFKENTYVGHNPIASLVMFLMMIIGVFTALSGYFLATETSNFLGFTLTEHFVKEGHEVLSKVFLILVLSHLAGIFSDAVLHRKMGTFSSIFTGYKNIETEAIQLNSFQKVFSVIWLVVPMLLFYLAFGLPAQEGENGKEGDKTEQNEGKGENEKNNHGENERDEDGDDD